MEPAALLLTLRKNWRSECDKYQHKALFIILDYGMAADLNPTSSSSPASKIAICAVSFAHQVSQDEQAPGSASPWARRAHAR